MEPITYAEFRALRDQRAIVYLLEFLPFAGTPLDVKSYGSVEHFYRTEQDALDAFAAIAKSGHVEEAELVRWNPNIEDDGWHRTTLDTYQAPPAVPVAVIDAITWWGSEAEGYSGIAEGGCTVAAVRYAEAGGIEGGLAVLARLLAGAHCIDVGPLSPAGWYWQAAIRGVWTRPKLAGTPADAMSRASAYLKAG